MNVAPWVLPARETERASELVRRLGVSPVTGHLLVQRGITDLDTAKAFLDPTLRDLRDPESLPGMGVAAQRLVDAVDNDEPVLLFGDYDVDGSTGAAILSEVLAALGGTVEVHIPNRDEGYGLNLPRLERAIAEGVRIVVSIDNGIAAIDEAAFLKEHGLDLIVADHHTIGSQLPDALALIHPRLPGAPPGNEHLCGAGVAFKLAWATAARKNGGRPTKKLQQVLLNGMALVALGTVADVVPLVGENRALVRYGLRALHNAPRAGLRALVEISRIVGQPSATDVAFRLAPRLNAAGRMGDAQRAFDLLTATDPADAERLARELDRENTRRRDVQARVYAAACAQVEEVYGAEVQAAGIVVGGDDWPHGIVGIVAAKLTETYHRPALVASLEGTVARGSGRTTGGVNLLAALEHAAEGNVGRHGGHAAAVGFSLIPGRLEDLRMGFDLGVKRSIGLADDATPAEVQERLATGGVKADVEVSLAELDRQLLDELDRLAPFGCGNSEPIFAARDVALAGNARLMGAKGAHVEFHLRQGDQVLRTVAFGRGDLWDDLQPVPGGPRRVDVAFVPRINRWKGRARLELELKAIRFRT